MNILKYFLFVAAILLLASCQKDPWEDIESGDWNHERNVLSINLQNQIGPANIVRDESKQQITVYVDPDGLDYSAVKVNSILLSYKASVDVEEGSTMNFDNPEYKSQITVTSQTGKSLTWDVILEPYEWFYVNEWSIKEQRIFVSQEYGSAWDEDITGVVADAAKEMDNTIQIIKNGILDGKPYGVIINNPGEDGEYGSFKLSEDVDLNTKLRHLLPIGESDWEINLDTNVMTITQNGVTSTAKVTKEGNGIRLDYALPTYPPRWDYGAYDNYYAWSYKYYIDLE
jgi:hypothetical protein